MGEWREFLYKKEANEGEEMRRKRWKKGRKREEYITCRNGVNKRRGGWEREGVLYDWEIKWKVKKGQTISTLKVHFQLLKLFCP